VSKTEKLAETFIRTSPWITPIGCLFSVFMSLVHPRSCLAFVRAGERQSINVRQTEREMRIRIVEISRQFDNEGSPKMNDQSLERQELRNEESVIQKELDNFVEKRWRESGPLRGAVDSPSKTEDRQTVIVNYWKL
jgi:hypothetical protein